jgi:hypothetical protein
LLLGNSRHHNHALGRDSGSSTVKLADCQTSSKGGFDEVEGIIGGAISWFEGLAGIEQGSGSDAVARRSAIVVVDDANSVGEDFVAMDWRCF